MIAWPPFRMRIFMCSNGVTSAHELDAGLLEGRAAGGEACPRRTHWMKSSQNTGQASSTPKSSRQIARSRSPVAGAMRSTMPFGKATVSRTQAARAGSWASARPATVLRATTPLCGMLSQESTVKGGAAGGAAGAQAGEDQAEDGLRARRGCAVSATIAGWSGSKAPVAGSMK